MTFQQRKDDVAATLDWEALEAAVLGAPLEVQERMLVAIVSRAPIEVRERQAWRFAPGAVRTARLSERDGYLARMAVGREGDAAAIAEGLHRTLLRYAASAWPNERDLPTPKGEHEFPHRVLTLNRGEVPSTERIRKLIPARGQKNPRK